MSVDTLAQADGSLVVAGGHDGIEALYSTEVLMVESNGEFANEWCVEPSSRAIHHRTNAARWAVGPSCTLLNSVDVDVVKLTHISL